MDEKLRHSVRERAGRVCEYCRIPESLDLFPFQADHIIASKHQGPTALDNLAWSCFNCNVFKGSDIGSIDSETKELTPLFHPRQHDWDEHFEWNGPVLVGRTPIGRVTVAILSINLPERIEYRRLLIAAGLFPP